MRRDRKDELDLLTRRRGEPDRTGGKPRPEGRPKQATSPIAASYREPISLHLEIGERKSDPPAVREIVRLEDGQWLV
jgi:hypothetical protein